MTKRMLFLLTAAALTFGTGQAVAGSCGSSDHAKAEKLSAIAPLAKEAGFTTLTAALEAAGLTETLTEGGPFTVFAPTDEAFAKLPEGIVAALLAKPEELKKVLLFHVTAGSVPAATVVTLSDAETLLGQKVAITTENGVRVNDANVVQTDVQASNGIIHVIDTVLIPAGLEL